MARRTVHFADDHPYIPMGPSMHQHVVGGTAPLNAQYIPELSPYHAEAPFLPHTPPHAVPLHPTHPPQGYPCSPAEPQYLHCSLDPTFNRLITCDLSYPIELQPMIDPTVLLQDATLIPGHMKISCHGYPYKIEVKPERGNPRVTVGVLFQRLYENMQTAVSACESSALPIPLPHHMGPANPQRMKRLDFLASHRFAGLRLYDIKDNHWRLHVN